MIYDSGLNKEIPTVSIFDKGEVMAKNEPKEVRVNEIIQAAIEEFIEKGYDGASMDQIAKRAGVSKGGVYYHFS